MHSAVFRKLCGLLVCGFVLGAVGCVDLSAQRVTFPLTIAAAGYTTAPPVVPESVSAFVQSLGVNTHLAFPNTPYFNQPGSVVSALQYLGIPNVRDLSLANTDSISTAMNNAVATAGFKFDALLVGSGDVELGQNLASISAFLGANPGAVVAIEGPNEINDEPITYGTLTNTYAAGVLVTQDLSTAVQNNPSL